MRCMARLVVVPRLALTKTCSAIPSFPIDKEESIAHNLEIGSQFMSSCVERAMDANGNRER